MSDTEVPIYPGDQARIVADFADFTKPSMGPLDVTSVTVTIKDAAGAVIVAAAAMSWSAAEALWFYKWNVPSTAGGQTFTYVATLTALDAGLHSAPGELWIAPFPTSPVGPIAAQPAGVVPMSQHYIEPWCDESDIPPRRLTDSNGVRVADINLGWMISAATDLLYVGSGRKFRSGRSVIRPSRARHAATSAVYPFRSFTGFGGAWGFEAGWAWSTMGLGWAWTEQPTELVLQAPVRRINSVTVDGVLLSPDQYSVVGRRRLVRLGGVPWPVDQSDTQPITAAGTCQIDYEWGRDPKSIGRLACAELSIELALGFSGQDACKLPARVMSIATQGISVQAIDPLAFLKENLTGLPICDLFLRAENPTKRRRPSVFLSPDSVLNRTY